MTVVHGDSIFAPYVCAVYTCKCGRRAIRHGSSCGNVPRGWKAAQGRAHLCEACAERSESPGRRQSHESPVD
jgi:hypothetical protein